MKILTLLLVGFASLMIGQTAPNDPGGWKAAKWGMTEEEILTALSGQASRLPGEDKPGTAAISIEHMTIAGHECRVNFVPARSGELIRVAVTPTERNPPAVIFDDLLKRLMEEHGKPTSSDTRRDGLVLEQIAKWDFPTTGVLLKHTFSPAIRMSIILLTYEKKGAAENRDLHDSTSNSGLPSWAAAQKTDALTGQARTEFILRGKYVEAPSRSAGNPTMRVRCLVGKRSAKSTYTGGQLLEAYVDFTVMPDSQPSGILVHYRIDDGKVIDQFWSRSTDYRAGFFGPKELLNMLYGKTRTIRDGEPLTPVRKVVIATQEYVAGQIVAQFDMPDPKEVGEGCGLFVHDELKK
jgi:hypothetical protein